ncbi:MULTISPECIES: MAPEG family protein [unclassified Moraxella]|uniref:MAPEG family protein n=1 Tax=unclassified Moraxella TaxID=2685852 RepID=UPI003AF7FB1E
MFSWLPATNSSVILAMVVACLLPIVFAIIAKSLGGFKPADNTNPRVFMANLTGASARANAVQQNSYESLPIFLASVVVALLFFVPLAVVAKLAWLYVVLRVIYGLAYIANWSTFRSVIWALSMACPLMLFYLVVRLS